MNITNLKLPKSKINKYWAIVGVIITLFLVVFLVAESFHIPILTDISALSNPTFITALIGIGLLTVDVFLPIPSSLVMVANGALFGFVTGSILSLIGNLFGFLFAYWVGAQSSSLIHKFLSPKEFYRGNRILQRWGIPALIFTKPLPILAETTAIMSGVAKLPFIKSLMATMAGSLLVSVLYAWSGSQSKDFDFTIIIFITLICLSIIAWKIDKRWGYQATKFKK